MKASFGCGRQRGRGRETAGKGNGERERGKEQIRADGKEGSGL